MYGIQYQPYTWNITHDSTWLCKCKFNIYMLCITCVCQPYLMTIIYLLNISSRVQSSVTKLDQRASACKIRKYILPVFGLHSVNLIFRRSLVLLIRSLTSSLVNATVKNLFLGPGRHPTSTFFLVKSSCTTLKLTGKIFHHLLHCLLHN